MSKWRPFPIVAAMEKEQSAFGLPFRVTRHWLSLAAEQLDACTRDARGVPCDPILAQALPSDAESHILPWELTDPLGEASHRQAPRLVRQYRSRLLVRTTGQCFMFCRHCFRRSLLPEETAFLDDSTMASIADMLRTHPELREVLLSGGDPLTAPAGRLEQLLHTVRSASETVLIRLCTRAPIVLPSIVDDQLLAILEHARPLHMVLQINHPLELHPDFLSRAERLLRSGIPLHSQTVLLRGINDNVDVLTSLFSELVKAGIHPYYLFQGDLAAGTSHFRVPLSRGLLLYDELRRELSGLELPRYAVDAPGGGGKIYLPEGVVRRDGDQWILRTPSGSLCEYPEEPEQY
ncbi:MAG: KamA family radical SAM protein [Rectinemataceae bacterium]|nr:KamA family radical SAM protein [Spirochaetaceae bacterium]